MVQDCDVVVIGGGIAGASISAYLAEFASVRLLEMEDHIIRPGDPPPCLPRPMAMPWCRR